MSAGLDRAGMLASHPVLTRSFTIPTPPLKHSVQTMIHLIASGASHGAWVAPPRIGKTSATEYAEQCLAEAFPSLPIFRYISRHTKQPTERAFYADLLHQLGAGGIDIRTPASDCLAKVVRFMFATAQSKGSRTVLFIGDEMQEFSEHQFSWLMDVTNELHRLGVRMIAILFGQRQLLNVRSALHAQERSDILGRFLYRSYAFHGIRSAEELCEVMRAYDDSSIRDYPASSGLSFTEFFFPLAYRAGWRLSGEAFTVWGQFKEIAKPSLSAPEVERLDVGMEWIVAAIQHLFTHRLELDSARFRPQSSDWQEAVQMSGFGASLPYLYCVNP